MWTSVTKRTQGFYNQSVYQRLNHVKGASMFLQRSVALASYHTQRSCGCKWEAGPDQSCVPANEIGMGDCYSQLAISSLDSF